VSGIRLGYGQSNGSRLLRERIARLYGGATVDNVSVTNGSAEANFAAMWTLVGPGDEVAVVAPTYMQTAGLGANFGASVKEIPLRQENGWQPDPDDIAGTVTAKTRLLVVTNPNNPTGAVLSAEARKAIIDAIERTGAWLLADEVYTGAELAGDVETPSFFGAAERVIATGSLSKAYGLPGLRIGWAVGAPAAADDLWARTDYTTISPGELTDRLAGVALEPGVRDRLRARTREYIHAGLEALEDWMRTEGVFTWRRPDAGAICFARYDLPVNSSELAERLRVDHSVLIVPGDQFGRDGYVRFGFGLPGDELRPALARMSECLDGLRTSSAAG
jgi:aspartate/methionine/tyrosine aminotransferase